MNKLNPSHERDKRRAQARMDDENEVLRLRKKGLLDWRERHNKKYVLGFARDYDWNASRLERAIETIGYRERLKDNKRAAAQ